MKKGWQIKTIGEVFNLIGGGTPPKAKPAFCSGDILGRVFATCGQISSRKPNYEIPTPVSETFKTKPHAIFQ
jgi:hypothetical protein